MNVGLRLLCQLGWSLDLSSQGALFATNYRCCPWTVMQGVVPDAKIND